MILYFGVYENSRLKEEFFVISKNSQVLEGPYKSYFKNGGKERRKIKERRHPEERRDGWLRVGQWRSVSVFDNKS